MNIIIYVIKNIINDKVYVGQTKKKMSESKKGNKNNLGHSFSEETKKKLSELRKGKRLVIIDGKRTWI